MQSTKICYFDAILDFKMAANNKIKENMHKNSTSCIHVDLSDILLFIVGHDDNGVTKYIMCTGYMT